MPKFERKLTKATVRTDFTKLRARLANINPAVAATLRNAVPRNGRSPQSNELNPMEVVNTHKLEKLSNIISNNINAATDLRQITPYIDKAEIIWSTLILYPNGQQDKILTYNTQASDIRNDKLHTELLKAWNNYFTNDYKIERQLRKMLNDILWNTGSYTLLNLSRPHLDYLINGSQLDSVRGAEAYEMIARKELDKNFTKVKDRYLMRNLGKFIRNPKGGLETVSGIEALFSTGSTTTETEFPLFQFDDEADNKAFEMLTITDNPAILFMQKINAAGRSRDVQSVTGIESYHKLIEKAIKESKADGTLVDTEGEGEDGQGADEGEDANGNKRKGKPGIDFSRTSKRKPKPNATTEHMSLEQQEAIQNNLFTQRNPGFRQIQFIKTPDALSVTPYGSGITWHVPSEAVIPVHYNGNSSERLDYILLLDDEGNFLKNTNDYEFYQSSKVGGAIDNKNKTGSDNHLVSSLRKAQEGRPCDFDMAEFADLAKASIIKRFLGSVVSGKSDSISISLDEETNKIWLARILKAQAVRCLYVPGECLTYMTFKTNNRLGTGQSLTQSAKMHIARLAAYDLADALANIEGAQPHTLMTINVEKEDPDPMSTIAMSRQTYFRANPRLHGILATAQLSVPQIVDALREQALTVKINPGENPYIPAPDIDMSQMEKGNFKPVDDNSRQKVLNDIANYFVLPRAWLDVSEDQNNFQIEALAEHQMLLNQTVNWQEMFAENVMDFQKKHVVVNEPLMAKLISIIATNKALWKPDSGELTLEGTETDKVNTILVDFINNVYCEFPRPNSTESTAKLRDSLNAVGDLVKLWEELSGHENMIRSVMKAMGVEIEDKSDEDIKSMIHGVFMTTAFKRYNLPMPFDNILADGKAGGIASLVNDVSFMRDNVAEFVSKLLLEQVKTDKKLAKLGDKINKAKGVEPEQEPPMGDDTGATGEEDGTVTDQDNPDFNPFGGGAEGEDTDTAETETDGEEPETGAAEGESETGEENESKEGDESVETEETAEPPVEEETEKTPDEQNKEDEDYNPF